MTPPHAALIWADANSIHLSLPNTVPGGASHTLTLPNSTQGLDRLARLLAERASASDLRLATPAAPTKAQLAAEATAALAAPRKEPSSIFSPELRNAARDILRKAGLVA